MPLILLSLLYYLLVKSFFDKYARKRLQKLVKTSEAIDLRKKMKRMRIVGLGFIFFSFLLIYVVSDYYIIGEKRIVVSFIQGALSLLMGYLIYDTIITNTIKTHKGNISVYSKTSWLQKHGNYSLYLRAFESDDNVIEMRSSHTDDDFSEYQFVKMVEERTSFCAIGMTKELDSPFGATRVYVDDKTWQADVLDLMKESSSIIILVSDRPSCLWEIEQSFSYLEKTTYIFHDKSKYEVIRALLAKTRNDISFPEIQYDREHYYARQDGDDILVTPYENTTEDYQRIITDSTGVVPYQGRMIGCVQKVGRWIAIILLFILSVIIGL